MPKFIKANFVLVCLLIFASFTRLWSLQNYPPSLFSDEVDVALQVKSFLATGRDYYGNFLPLQFHSFSDVRTAIPIYLTAILGKVIGNIELAVRLEPAIMGILGVLAIYLLAKSFFGKTTGLLAALLLTLTPWHFTYSRVGFEVTTLFAFFVFGLYFLKNYFASQKDLFLVLGILLLSLTPLIYSTAKLALLFLPFLTLFFPGTTFSKNLKNRNLLIGLALLFLPLAIITLSGGATSRFNYISIFTDPTTPTEINVVRKADQGEDLPVGTKPLIMSQVFRNKYVVYGQRISTNLFGLLSNNFLFVKGDLNLRHALPDWGMLLKTESIFILIGIYFLIQREEKKQKHLLLFFGFLIILSIFPGSLTRDGGGHATRSFLLLVPLTLLAALGAETVVKQARYLLILFLPLLIFESAFYFFDYAHRYVFLSQRQWHFGLKEIILGTKTKTGPVVITNSYEPPVIFYLYYSGYPVKEMQSLIRDDKLLVTIPTGANLSGRKITDREVYFASIDNRNDKEPLKLKPATYYLMKSDLPKHEDYFKLDRVVVKLPSGEPLFYEIKNL
ncbi:MAG: Glycosyl transferase family 39 [Candidatus Nomurabacteria bacterium GW2011_GWA1_46_11]|uniref:Glycosyl transferase family 39 n=1 Tax=Candidatus Nomurabacteria bacterium GW2011_GWA1_46_11 TaxID=1618732 RepID=A0A0G1NJQ0_9BACT|nr:MAG: Glycosyl transferase family 39 [Candidatus Nomurabacteria bacterium GW2011_GWA1_46_11]